MKRLPEGVRRICVVIGLILAASCFLFFAIASDGFHKFPMEAWATLGVFMLMLYLLPSLTYRVFRWIKEGFIADSPR